MNYKTTPEIELAVAEFFNPRQHLILPNIWWGMGLNHECDLFIVSKNNYASEIEIKVNKYDLKKDQKKGHGHSSNLIRRLYFAIPPELKEFNNYIPEHAGIIIVYAPGELQSYYGHICKIERPAKINKMAKPLIQYQILHLGRLAAMRIWTLKRTLLERNDQNK